MATTLSVGEFNARLPESLALVEKGETVTVTYGHSKRPVAVFGPPPAPPKRKLGLLVGKATVRFAPDWKITEKELLGE